MKKKLLLSVLAAGLVLPTASALAVEGSGWTGLDNNSGKTAVDANAEAKAKLEAAEAKAKAEAEAKKAAEAAEAAGKKGTWVEENATLKTTQGENEIFLQGKQQNIPGEQGAKVEDKKAPATPDKKAPVVAKKAPAKKALPKTSAVK